MSENDKAKPQDLNDTELEDMNGGFPGSTFENLNAKITTTYFDDGLPSRKVVLAQASGGGNIAGNGGAPTPKEYTFGEDIGDDIIPVTYKLID